MPLYFFMVHALAPGWASLSVPLYIEANDQISANAQATTLKAAFSSQFQLLFEPSEPLLLVPAVNGPTFHALISDLKLSPTVSINLPANSALTLHQQLPSTSPLTAVAARSLVPGLHSWHYAL